MVIDAVAGLGEDVVSGDVIPDHFVVDTKNKIIESSTGGGAREGASAIVGDAQMLELAMIGGRIAEHFRQPQDIEWAVHLGRLFILQYRAMTALPPALINLSRMQRALCGNRATPRRGRRAG